MLYVAKNIKIEIDSNGVVIEPVNKAVADGYIAETIPIVDIKLKTLSPKVARAMKKALKDFCKYQRKYIWFFDNKEDLISLFGYVVYLKTIGGGRLKFKKKG